MKHEQIFDEWLEERRGVSPPTTLPDQIMVQIAELERQRQSIWWLRLVQQIERSRAARWCFCGGALAIGGLPFLLLTHVSSL